MLDLKKFAIIFGASTLSGFITGMLGVGAGLVNIPVLLLLNV